MDSQTSEDSDEVQNEVKRVRHEPKSYSLSRKYNRTRRNRFSSKDCAYQIKDNLQALIFDSGAYSIKINYSTNDQPKLIPNCIMKAKSERKRLFIGNQIDECRDCSGLFYLLPCEKGYITKWDVQKPIWDYVFCKNSFPINDFPVIMTQPLFNFQSIQDCIDEIFFEEYEVSSMFRANPTDFAYLKYREEFSSLSCIIVDSGYSFTHIVPYINNKKYWKAIKRINIGGKLLTNHLKDIISYRQYHVMEETYVINQVKEDTCYVSENFKNDLKIASLSSPKNNIVRNYVLPDFNNIRRGYIQNPDKIDEFEENCQILRLNNERFTVPEILFYPSDIGIKSIGIAESVYKSILNCPLKYQKDLSKNIILCGGSTKFPGFKKRFYNEIRSMINSSWEVNVYQPENPITYSWMGGKSFLQQSDFKSHIVTKEQYDELGVSTIQKKFNDWSSAVEEKQKKKSIIKPISYIEHLKKYDVFGKKENISDEEEIYDTTKNNNNNNSNNIIDEKNINIEKIVSEDAIIEAHSISNIVESKSKIMKQMMLKKNIKSSAPVVYSVKIISPTLRQTSHTSNNH